MEKIRMVTRRTVGTTMSNRIILVVRRMEFNKIHLESTLNKTKKPNITAGLSAFAPPIGESCSFASMINYSIILKSKTYTLIQKLYVKK